MTAQAIGRNGKLALGRGSPCAGAPPRQLPPGRVGRRCATPRGVRPRVWRGTARPHRAGGTCFIRVYSAMAKITSTRAVSSTSPSAMGTAASDIIAMSERMSGITGPPPPPSEIDSTAPSVTPAASA